MAVGSTDKITSYEEIEMDPFVFNAEVIDRVQRRSQTFQSKSSVVKTFEIKPYMGSWHRRYTIKYHLKSYKHVEKNLF